LCKTAFYFLNAALLRPFLQTATLRKLVCMFFRGVQTCLRTHTTEFIYYKLADYFLIQPKLKEQLQYVEPAA